MVDSSMIERMKFTLLNTFFKALITQQDRIFSCGQKLRMKFEDFVEFME